ncbi:hypothetical protein I4U23_031211 [Adineta vaga]|nr:hypothetical protein I4U23_031211 [Adineta vaga]
MMYVKYLFDLIFLHCIIALPQMNLYYTDEVSSNEYNDKIGIGYGCFRLASNMDQSYLNRQISSYCMSESSSKFHIEIDDSLQKFSFRDLKIQNITNEDLYFWSIPIDIIERYEIYFQTNDLSLEKEILYNCTLPRFGSMCQYELYYYHENYSSLYEIINGYYRSYFYDPTNLTCYIHLKCNRGYSSACLDWTEICNGKVDCLDNSIDEEYCWQLEFIECNQNEYQCRFGYCIPNEFIHDNPANFDCIDRSDETFALLNFIMSAYKQQPVFGSEDVICEKIFLTTIEDGNCDCNKEGDSFCEDEHKTDNFTKRTILFQTICDGIQELYPIMINGINETDETECQQWECDNIYTHCDGFWNCFYGEDEMNCPSLSSSPVNCSLDYRLCVTKNTSEFMCLPINKINDGIVDCLGGTDESSLCLSTGTYKEKGFYCRTNYSSTCLKFIELCNGRPNCLYGDDEQFCDKNRSLTMSPNMCLDTSIVYASDVEKFLCNYTKSKKKELISFTIDKFYELPENKIHEKELFNVITLNNNKPIPLINESRCHHGLDLHIWLNKSSNLSTSTCLCPPTYYGNQCQYQNQRISLVMRFHVPVQLKQTLFLILIMLIDNTNQRTIHSYEQFTYLSIRDCKIKFNIYLLYSTRPKQDFNRTYSIHIDIYEKYSLTYRTSYFYPVKFSFLPVHRLAFIINIPIEDEKICSNKKCSHGKCRNYFNIKQTFCQCDQGWSGIFCNISYNYKCSLNSSCTGLLNNNRSICICKENYFGSHCYLRNQICDKSPCQNHGLFCCNNLNVIEQPFSCSKNHFHCSQCISQGCILCQFRQLNLGNEINYRDMSVNDQHILYTCQIWVEKFEELQKSLKNNSITISSNTFSNNDEISQFDHQHRWNDEEQHEELGDCMICLEPLNSSSCRRLEICGHSFHQSCIDQWFQSNGKQSCPSCGYVYGISKGPQPSNGQMSTRFIQVVLPGFESYSYDPNEGGTIEITYSFQHGIQSSLNPNPGSSYSGTVRKAYLPNIKEGKEILNLLIRAFNDQHIFTIGKSVTTGMDNVITWNDIHHKTNLYGGPDRFGYPDPTYLHRVRQELADKGFK